MSLSFSYIHKDIQFQIFGYLTPTELAKAERTCKEWKAIISILWKDYLKDTDLEKEFPELTIIKGGMPKNFPPYVNRNAYSLIKKLIPLVEDNAGVSIVTIAQGFEYEKALRNPKLFISDPILIDDFNGKVAAKTERYLVSNYILKGTLSKPFHIQEKEIKALGYEIPDLMTMGALAANEEELSQRGVVLYAKIDSVHTRLTFESKGMDHAFYFSKDIPGIFNMLAALPSPRIGTGAQKRL